jgi:hypothetical protein
MGRNYLTGRDGDRINAVLAAAGGKKLVDRLSTKEEVEDGKSVTSSAQPNCAS